jgi:hypothetical protein
VDRESRFEKRDEYEIKVLVEQSVDTINKLNRWIERLE